LIIERKDKITMVIKGKMIDRGIEECVAGAEGSEVAREVVVGAEGITTDPTTASQ